MTAIMELEISMDELLDNLRSEILNKYNFYKDFSLDSCNILSELDNYLKSPLEHYNSDTGDIFLMALGNFYNVAITIFQSDGDTCWTTDLTNKDREKIGQLYFGRGSSLHFDAIVPCDYSPKDQCHSDSDVEVTGEVPAHDVAKQRANIKEEESSYQSDDSDIVYTKFVPGNISSKVHVKTEKNNSNGNKRNPSFEIECPLCKEKLPSSEEFKSHIANSQCIGKEATERNDSGKSDCSSDNYEDTDCSDEEISINPNGQYVFGKEFWSKCSMKHESKIPFNIDGICCYSIEATNRNVLLDKCRDGRPWKKDTRTKWSNYDSVRYKNCGGGFECPNTECVFVKEYGHANKLKFTTSKVCTICGAIGNPIECKARKYIAINGNIAHIFHYGYHRCEAKSKSERPSSLVLDSLQIDPSMKPSAIQGNAILTAMRGKKSWDDIEKTVKKLTNKKAISNEKIKQRQQMHPKGTDYYGVLEYKKYTDKKDGLYIFNVDENNQYVFKSSQQKMRLAYNMDCTKDHFLAKEYCCFDGKVKRTKNFTTLTASVYHPLLQKQVPLAIMECKSEDEINIGNFWKEFNTAFKRANNCECKFNPIGWTSDMATANFRGLERIYGDEITNKIKGCEFHYKQSINRRSNMLEDKVDMFKDLANEMLIASTRESYDSAQKKMSEFLNENDERKKLLNWFSWWHDRRFSIFRAFTGYKCPRSNLAEVVHASWVNRNQQGLTLLEAAEFDTRDTLIIESELSQYMSSSQSFGCGPSLHEVNQRNSQREVNAATKKGSDLVNFGVTVQSNKRKNNTSDTGSDASKKSKTISIDKMLQNRLNKAKESDEKIKVRKLNAISKRKRVYVVSSSNFGKTNYEVVITNVPSCSCPDFVKNGDKVFCKHILHVVINILNGGQFLSSLRDKYLSDNQVDELFEKNSKNIPEKYQQKNTQKAKKDFGVILQQHPDFTQQQNWMLHLKASKTAKCSSCKSDIQREKECFSVNGALTVPYDSNSAVSQKFYFCAEKICISSFRPWTNVQPPTSFTFDGMSEERAQEIAVKLNLSVK